MVPRWGRVNLKNYTLRVFDLRGLHEVVGLQLHRAIVSIWCLHKLCSASNLNPLIPTFRRLMTKDNPLRDSAKTSRACIDVSGHKCAAFCDGPYFVSFHDSFCAPSSGHITCAYVQVKPIPMAKHQLFGRCHVHRLLAWSVNKRLKAKGSWSALSTSWKLYVAAR